MVHDYNDNDNNDKTTTKQQQGQQITLKSAKRDQAIEAVVQLML